MTARSHECRFAFVSSRISYRCYFVLLLLFVVILLLWFNNSEYEYQSPAVNYRVRQLLDRLANQRHTGIFKRPPGTEDLKCANLVRGIMPFWVHRVSQTDPDDLPMTCEDIFARNHFSNRAGSRQEVEFPLAVARNVYRDYLFQELELASTYSPTNTYCFALDLKATPVFKQRLAALARCLPNVLIVTEQFNLTSGGANQDQAHLACLRRLASFEWRYVVLLQNYDVALKTNAEMVQVLQWLQGANDVAVKPLITADDRLNTSGDWKFQALNLFKNETRNRQGHDGLRPELTFVTGFNQCSLSRAFVEFVLEELRLDSLLALLGLPKYGVDEQLFPTLQVTAALNAPGGYPYKCVQENVFHATWTRKSDWKGTTCGSGRWRHSLCLYGVEDLHRFPNFPHLFANKMMPSFDWGAFVCWKEHLFNRTHQFLQPSAHVFLDSSIYLKSTLVRFNNERNKHGFSLNRFNCTGA